MPVHEIVSGEAASLRKKPLEPKVGGGTRRKEYKKSFLILALAPFFAWAKRRNSGFAIFLCSSTPRKRRLKVVLFYSFAPAWCTQNYVRIHRDYRAAVLASSVCIYARAEYFSRKTIKQSAPQSEASNVFR